MYARPNDFGENHLRSFPTMSVIRRFKVSVETSLIYTAKPQTYIVYWT